tara:strand:- start:329 stop:793 length:465 start_codon:yes stop_codon:yes gene_type:complete
MIYRVGQILFLIADASKVVPIQVVEEVIRTTLEGKEKTYIIKFPDKKATVADIKKIKGQLFNSQDEVKVFMLQNAQNAIEQMVSQAAEMSINIFNSHPVLAQIKENDLDFKDAADGKIEKVQPNEDEGIIRVDLGNGKFGKIDSKNLSDAGVPQ